MNKDLVIGVLGGMGTYATIHLFQQYAEVFNAEKEWDRPRIIIDNRCTMPSRVRAFLYNEKDNELVEEMVDSLLRLKNAGCNRILLACNTSHLFLPRIYDKLPDIENHIVNIIYACVDELVNEKLERVFILGSEGTIESRIYQDCLSSKGISCICPQPDEYSKLRVCIEAVKQNKYSEEAHDAFINLVNRYDSCILGCTELPILYEKYATEVKCKNVYDPLYLALLKIKKEFE